MLRFENVDLHYGSFRALEGITLHADAGELVVLVAHGGVMDVLYRAATRQDLQAPRTWHLGNAAINRLLWTPQGLNLVGWGDVSHLVDDALDEALD